MMAHFKKLMEGTGSGMISKTYVSATNKLNPLGSPVRKPASHSQLDLGNQANLDNNATYPNKATTIKM
jgi:hypothetical protein